MIVTPLGIDGAWLIEAPTYPDVRGLFREWFSDDLGENSEIPRFEVIQANTSISAKGVIRSAVGKDLGTRITPSLEFILDGLPESAKALDSLLERVHLLDAEVAKARENAKPVVEDAYKQPRVIDEE